MTHLAARPLEGFRVLDLTAALAGPYATLLLGGLGAEVICVEAPGGGDLARGNPPFAGCDGVSLDQKGTDQISLSILNRARNKKSITLDLKSGRGRAILLDLAKHVDIVVENMSEGTADRLGVGYEDVRQSNPALVYASINALGDPSLYPGLKGMDIIVQALSGLMEVTGFAEGPPTRTGLPFADLIAPLFAVNGILCALIYRARTGEGQHVKVSMLDCLASLVACENFDIFGKAGYAPRTGNSIDRAAPFGIYKTLDGYVAIVAFQAKWMTGLLDAMGQPELIDDPRFRERGPRMRHAGTFNAIVEMWTNKHTCDEVIRELLHLREVPAARVRGPMEVLHDPRLHERGAVVNLTHPDFGPIGAVGMGLPIQFSKCSAQFDRPAMRLGEANSEIYGDLLGIPADEIEKLQAVGVI